MPEPQGHPASAQPPQPARPAAVGPSHAMKDNAADMTSAANPPVVKAREHVPSLHRWGEHDRPQLPFAVVHGVGQGGGEVGLAMVVGRRALTAVGTRYLFLRM